MKKKSHVVLATFQRWQFSKVTDAYGLVLTHMNAIYHIISNFDSKDHEFI